MDEVVVVFLLAATVHGIAATEGNLPGPCREWLFPCEGGRWQCTSEEAYQRYQREPQPECPTSSNETTPTPPTGQECQLVNGTCQYTPSNLECIGQGQCYEVTCQSAAMAPTNQTCPPQYRPPPPDNLCLPINGSCQWFNPCHVWREPCFNPYRCGTISEYYAFLFTPNPPCHEPPEWVAPSAPGECVINADHECAWSNCTVFLDICQYAWICGTQYELAVQQSSPPPPCPPPPPNTTYPPPRPAKPCLFSVESQRCQFHPVPTTIPPPPPTTTPPTISATSSPTCPEGMQHTTCGSACPVTCDNRGDPPACIQACVERCVCAKGTILTADNSSKCIPPYRCDDQDGLEWVEGVVRLGSGVIGLIIFAAIAIGVLLYLRHHYRRNARNSRMLGRNNTVDASPVDSLQGQTYMPMEDEPTALELPSKFRPTHHRQ